MVTHQNWSAEGFDLSPISPLVGPFSDRTWLEVWWRHRGIGDLIVTETADSLLALTAHNEQIRFAGEADLTDYHSPRGTASALTELVGELKPGTAIILDSLPEDSAAAVSEALAVAGLNPVMEQHTVTATLELPTSFDEYLSDLGKKERHELRRKRRKFDAEAGTARLERRSGPDAVALFASLHRRSSGDKGTFMSTNMEDFFLALHTEADAVIDVLVDGMDRPAAAIFSFEDDHGFYLYNSAFEPDIRNLSPGNVILSHLIERSIASGKHVFDFLKGDETYKFRLGASPRPLFVVTATR